MEAFRRITPGRTPPSGLRCRSWWFKNSEPPAILTTPPQVMAVKIRISSLLRDHCGGAPELSASATSVRAALAELEMRHPALHRSICNETGALRRHVNLFVNTKSFRDLQGLDTPLTAGDVVTILQAVSGG